MVMSVDHEAIRSWCKTHTHAWYYACVSMRLSRYLCPVVHTRTHTHPPTRRLHHDTKRLVVAELHVYERIVEVDGHEAGWTL